MHPRKYDVNVCKCLLIIEKAGKQKLEKKVIY